MEILKTGLVWIIPPLIHFFVLSTTTGAKLLMQNKDTYWYRAEVTSTDACYNLPRGHSYHLFATDTCFIAYDSVDCEASQSLKFLPGNTSYEYGFYTLSLQTCNEQEGGSQLNIDITTHVVASRPPIVQKIFESYKNVRTCLNVPKYVQDMSKWSINNHANGLFAYFEPNCMTEYSRPVYIDAGHNDKSREMHTHKRTNYNGTIMKVQSLGPDPNSTFFSPSCVEYPNDEIMKFELIAAFNNSGLLNPAIDLNETLSELTTGANSDLMHFFADIDYKGFHFGSRSTSTCNNFPKPVQRRWVSGVRSIKTETCVILYSDDDCMGRSVKIDAPGSSNLTNVWKSTVKSQDTFSLLYTQYPNWKWETKSYHVCNKEIGGSSLKVDIVSGDAGVDPRDGNVVLESYRNLCSCRNVPEYVQQLKSWSINNYGNPLVVYYSRGCLSSIFPSVWIPAGHSSYSFGMGLFRYLDETTGISHKIQSFGPDPNAEYFKINCNSNSTTISIPNPSSGEDFYGKIETTKIISFMVERMSALTIEFRHISSKVDELKQVNEEVVFKIESVKNDLEDQLQKNRDEFQDIMDKIKRDLTKIFA